MMIRSSLHPHPKAQLHTKHFQTQRAHLTDVYARDVLVAFFVVLVRLFHRIR